MACMKLHRPLTPHPDEQGGTETEQGTGTEQGRGQSRDWDRAETGTEQGTEQGAGRLWACAPSDSSTARPLNEVNQQELARAELPGRSGLALGCRPKSKA
ncbi:unnamed protein product [Pleuronectes platessa]|uniref:Uncharacterized protein n=1 Tax=Pleuronectes platessa TaxID=8262 RepID=A0A9N7VG10_PLEPL|nr:unnamed protein product [Pleuronectes platessa]